MHEQLIPEETVIRCHACGRENPASHRFCGVCGATLEADGDSQCEGSEEESKSGSSNREWQDREREKARISTAGFETSISNPNELSLFRSFRPKETSSEDDWGNEPSHRRRIYIGMVLAVIIGSLGYMAWRKAHSGSQNSPGTRATVRRFQSASCWQRLQRIPPNRTAKPRRLPSRTIRRKLSRRSRNPPNHRRCGQDQDREAEQGRTSASRSGSDGCSSGRGQRLGRARGCATLSRRLEWPRSRQRRGGEMALEVHRQAQFASDHTACRFVLER